MMEPNQRQEQGAQVSFVELVNNPYKDEAEVHIHVNGDPLQFQGNITATTRDGRVLKIQTVERYMRREREKERKAMAVSEEEKQARREEHHQEWVDRKKREREETEKRWEERNVQEGRVLTKEEHMERDLENNNKKKKGGKMKSLSLFFRPVGKENTGEADLVDTKAIANNNNNNNPVPDSGEKQLVRPPLEDHVETESTPEAVEDEASHFKKGMKVCLRLAVMDKETIDEMKMKDAKSAIQSQGIIGKVIIQEMIGNSVAMLSMDEFDRLCNHSLRAAGKEVDRDTFAQLKQKLKNAHGKVHVKYLTKQNRHRGQNHKWTDAQVDEIRQAVEQAQERHPQSCYAKAAEMLRTKFSGPIFGSITSDQVRNVYRLKVLKGNQKTRPVGRPPRKLSDHGRV